VGFLEAFEGRKHQLSYRVDCLGCGHCFSGSFLAFGSLPKVRQDDFQRCYDVLDWGVCFVDHCGFGVWENFEGVDDAALPQGLSDINAPILVDLCFEFYHASITSPNLWQKLYSW